MIKTAAIPAIMTLKEHSHVSNQKAHDQCSKVEQFQQ